MLKLNSGLVAGFLLLCQEGSLAAFQTQLFETPEILRVDVATPSDQMNFPRRGPKVGAVATVTEK